MATGARQTLFKQPTALFVSWILPSFICHSKRQIICQSKRKIIRPTKNSASEELTDFRFQCIDCWICNCAHIIDISVTITAVDSTRLLFKMRKKCRLFVVFVLYIYKCKSRYIIVGVFLDHVNANIKRKTCSKRDTHISCLMAFDETWHHLIIIF